MKRPVLSSLATAALAITVLAGNVGVAIASTGTATLSTTAADAQAEQQDPAPVAGLQVSGNDLHSITLSWAPATDTDRANVLIRRASGDQPPLSADDGTLVAALGRGRTTFTDRQLTAGTTYSYAVFALNRTHRPSTPATVTATTRTTDGHTGLKGVLTDRAGNPISGAWAEVREVDTGNWDGVATTAADGSFKVPNLQPGNYSVCFEVTPQTSGPSPTGYLNGCYRQQPFGYGDSGTPVTVVAGKMTGGIKDYLPVAGAISGRITDPSGTGIGNVDVYVTYPYPVFTFYSAYTDADGSYTITGLPADSYQICFDASNATGPSSTGYLDECYDNRPLDYGDDYTPIPVTLGHTAGGVDAVLDIGAAVTGTVTDQAGNPVEGAFVTPIPDNGKSASTDAQGHYTITGVAPGQYTMCFDGTYASSPSAPYGYTSDCFDGLPSFDLAAGQTVTQNDTLTTAGGIGGSVSGVNGPVAGVWVNVYDHYGALLNSISSDENGDWQLSGFAPGQYAVCYDPSYTSGGYRPSCFHGQPDDPASGTPVTVTAGQLTTVDDTLE